MVLLAKNCARPAPRQAVNLFFLSRSKPSERFFNLWGLCGAANVLKVLGAASVVVSPFTGYGFNSQAQHDLHRTLAPAAPIFTTKRVRFQAERQVSEMFVKFYVVACSFVTTGFDSSPVQRVWRSRLPLWVE